MKCLNRILLTSKKPKESNEAIGIKKIENFEFVLMLVLQCKVLQIVNIPSKSLQPETYDLFSAHNLLQNALLRITSFRNKFEEQVIEASEISGEWGLPGQFTKRRIRKNKRHFDELSEDEKLNDPEKLFSCNYFYLR